MSFKNKLKILNILTWKAQNCICLDLSLSRFICIFKLLGSVLYLIQQKDTKKVSTMKFNNTWAWLRKRWIGHGAFRWVRWEIAWTRKKWSFKKDNFQPSWSRLLFGDKVLADQLLVEHVEEVVKVLLQELIGENLVPKIKNIFSLEIKDLGENLRRSSLKVVKASEAKSNLGLST